MRIMIGLLVLVAGYVIGAAAGYALIAAMTSNTHDAPIEAAMTGAFVTGPALAVAAAIVWFVATRSRPSP